MENALASPSLKIIPLGEAPLSANPTIVMPFLKFILKVRTARLYLIVALITTTIQIVIFKYFYPYPDFFSDSYSYIFAASAHLDVSIWPIGYSKFLALFHFFTHSDVALTSFQYFLLELSSIYFYFTIIYFYNPRRAAKNILFCGFFINPLFLYISNYVNSDSLFAALSLFWFTELLWIINKPKIYQILTQGVLLFLCFTVRNNAYYYPIVAIIAFILSKQNLTFKIAGCLFGLVLIGTFINYTRNAAKELTGTAQFSLFTGWQLANNALYMYNHINIDSNHLPSNDSKELNRLSKTFYSKTPPEFDAFLSDYDGNFFIKYPGAPLKNFLNHHYKYDSEIGSVKSWGQASVKFNEYGSWLIKKYPFAYIKHFILPNTQNYFLPFLEKLEVYNLGEHEVGTEAEVWFDYKTPTINVTSNTIQGSLLAPFPFAFLFLNIFTFGSILWLLFKLKSISINYIQKSSILIFTTFIFLNYIFCISATIIVMRYEFFPMLMLLSLSLLVLDIIEKTDANSKNILI